jgi:UDP:flavonoid glycosyltransferase YjiC (YdhE family)
VAGASEAKNDINARLDYRGLALDLRTERPTRRQILRGVERVLSERHYRENIARVRAELATYDPFAIIEREVVAPSASRARSARKQVVVFRGGRFRTRSKPA